VQEIEFAALISRTVPATRRQALALLTASTLIGQWLFG